MYPPNEADESRRDSPGTRQAKEGQGNGCEGQESGPAPQKVREVVAALCVCIDGAINLIAAGEPEAARNLLMRIRETL